MITYRGCALGLAVAALGGLPACSARERDFDRSSGTAGAGGETSSSSSGCAAAEACFNGVDDDCDGNPDCADPDCAAGAVCVAAPQDFELGMVVNETDACPDGFTANDTVLHRGISGGCDGCGCSANPTGCSADVFTYATNAECLGDGSLTGGNFARTVGFTCDSTPFTDQYVGLRVSSFRAEPSCSPSGHAEPGLVRWSESKKFCRAVDVGAGCSAGKACVPAQPRETQCALASGSLACDGYVKTEDDWFVGYEDSRSCAPCSCRADGDCSGVHFELGNDYSCYENARLSENTRSCAQGYSPPGYLVGTPAASCTGFADVLGSLTPSGQSTLCCLE